MRIKDIVVEDFINYRLPSIFIASAFCDWKCCTEQNLPVETCQNSALAAAPIRDIPDYTLWLVFTGSDIAKAVVIGGLEPFQQIAELFNLIKTFRDHGTDCPFVIYTGYTPDEIQPQLALLRPFGNIIVKFGRYVPGDPPHVDPVLGVLLASNNQFAEQIC